MTKKTDFITQAKIDDEKFMDIFQQYRNIQAYMNLKYHQLKKKTNHSLLFVDQQREFRERTRSTSINPTRNSSRVCTPKLYNTSRTAPPKKDDQLFVVKKVNVKAQRPDTADPNMLYKRRPLNS